MEIKPIADTLEVIRDLAACIREYQKAPAFRNMPVGAPNSSARAIQEAHINAENMARIALVTHEVQIKKAENHD